MPKLAARGPPAGRGDVNKNDPNGCPLGVAVAATLRSGGCPAVRTDDPAAVI